MNKLTRIEGRIENIKQRINSLKGGASFSAHFDNAKEKLKVDIAAKTGAANIPGADKKAVKNPIADVTVKMPRITYEKGAAPKNAAALTARDAIELKNTALTPEIGSIIIEKSGKHEIDPLLISAIMAVESDFNPKAVSDKGAIGLMQLMPETAGDLGVNPHNMSQNVEGGTRYIKQMLEKFSGDLKLALAAYNAGPNAVIRHGGIPPYTETQNYVLKVLKNYENFLKQTGAIDAGYGGGDTDDSAPGGISNGAANAKKAKEALETSAAAMTDAVFNAGGKNKGAGLFGANDGENDVDGEIYADE
jgi:hypothetical protein